MNFKIITVQVQRRPCNVLFGLLRGELFINRSISASKDQEIYGDLKNGNYLRDKMLQKKVRAKQNNFKYICILVLVVFCDNLQY